MIHRITCCLLSLACATALVADRASAQCLDWSDEFVSSGVSGGSVYAQITFDDGSGPALFVGGAFTTIGGVFANGLAKWDGLQWTPAGDVALAGNSSGVRAFAIFDDGTGPALFAGGSFTGIGGVAASNVAKWDGSHWSPVGAGTNGAVYALCTWDDGSGPALYAGGTFLQAGGASADRLAKWNGSSWSAVPSGFAYLSVQAPEVRALAVYDDGSGPALFVGGTFYYIGGLFVGHIAKWNGSSWSALHLGVQSPYGVYALTVFDDGTGPSLFLAGAFTSFPGQSNIARWNGGPDFIQVGDLSSNGPNSMRLYNVQSLCAFDDGTGARLYACGQPTTNGISPVRAWNGTQWTDGVDVLSPGQYDPVGPPIGDSLGAFDDGSGAQLFAAGRFMRSGNVMLNGFGSWDGATWIAHGKSTTANRQVRAFAKFDDGNGERLYAAGDFMQVGSVSASAIARFDGQTWSALTPPSSSADDAIRALTVFDDGTGDALYAAGEFNSIGGVTAHHVAKWNGASWSALGNGIPGNFDQWVNVLAVYDDGNGDALYAAGRFTKAGTLNNVLRIAKWDGAAWSKLGGGLGSEAYALCTYDDGNGDQLFVGGDFASSPAPTGGPYIASWDGANWHDVGGGTNGRVYALAEFDDGNGPALYVGGTFTLAGGASASKLARWNGSAWTSVGGGVNGQVESLAVFDDGSGPALYVAGSAITSAGGVPVRGIARWNGTQWSALGQGLLGFALNAMTTFDDALFVGGDVLLAGGRPSVNLAKWSHACMCSPVVYCTSGTTSSGCVPSISGSGTPSASAASGFTISVASVEGQRQGHIFYGLNGPNAAPWGASSHFLCVKAPSQRTGVQDSGGTAGACNGVIALDWNAYVATHPTSLGVPFSAGTSVWAQLYFRDPPGPKSTALSNGLMFYVCP